MMDGLKPQYGLSVCLVCPVTADRSICISFNRSGTGGGRCAARGTRAGVAARRLRGRGFRLRWFLGLYLS